MQNFIAHPAPPVVDGVTYDRLATSLVMSTVAPNGSDMLLRMVVTLTPYAMMQNGDESGSHVELLHDNQIVFIYPDSMAEAEGNPALAKFLQSVAASGQEFINEVF